MDDLRRRMLAGESVDVSHPEIQAQVERARRVWTRLNNLCPTDAEYRRTLLELIPNFPESSILCAPFTCDYGDRVWVGNNVFVNYNCCFLDGGGIRIGDNTLIGPSVQIFTPHHPVDYRERRKPIENSYQVTIGSDCWIGGGAVICPGVNIGDRCIIGAGSVVTKDIPPDSMAAGNPARVIRSLE